MLKKKDLTSGDNKETYLKQGLEKNQRIVPGNRSNLEMIYTMVWFNLGSRCPFDGWINLRILRKRTRSFPTS